MTTDEIQKRPEAMRARSTVNDAYDGFVLITRYARRRRICSKAS